tara:strand:- start:437 stop:679 length:243 start_codon:yes stop_codon:yes gene_type:complete
MSKEIAEWCGYDCMGDMIIDHLTKKELENMLIEYIQEDESGIIEDIIMEIATKKYEWVDHEAIKAEQEDAEYEKYRDGGI